MKDVVLDDLIKEDKQKNKLKRQARNSGRFDRRGGRAGRGGRGGFIRRGSTPRPFSRGDHQRQDRGDRTNRRRLIVKDRERGGPRRVNRLNRLDRNRDRPRKTQGRNQPQKRQKEPQQVKQQGQKQQKGRTLKVLGLHPDITNQDLYKLFAAEGALQKCMIQQDNFGRNLPSAIVKYYAAQTAKKSIQNLNGKKILNSVLTVQPYRNRK